MQIGQMYDSERHDTRHMTQSIVYTGLLTKSNELPAKSVCVMVGLISAVRNYAHDCCMRNIKDFVH